jgi:hypothetical protein
MPMAVGDGDLILTWSCFLKYHFANPQYQIDKTNPDGKIKENGNEWRQSV